MRTLTFSPNSLRKLLLHDKIATLPDLKRALAGCGKTPSFSEIRNLKFAEAKAGYS